MSGILSHGIIEPEEISRTSLLQVLLEEHYEIPLIDCLEPFTPFDVFQPPAVEGFRFFDIILTVSIMKNKR
jgi:hypothetical protein